MADDGGARLRQNPRRGRMDQRARAQAGIADRPGGGKHRRGAQRDGRGGERHLVGGAHAPRPRQMGAEPQKTDLAERDRRRTLFGRPCRRAARPRARRCVVRRTGEVAAGRGGMDEFATGAAIGPAAASAGDDDAAAAAPARTAEGRRMDGDDGRENKRQCHTARCLCRRDGRDLWRHPDRPAGAGRRADRRRRGEPVAAQPDRAVPVRDARAVRSRRGRRRPAGERAWRRLRDRGLRAGWGEFPCGRWPGRRRGGKPIA